MEQPHSERLKGWRKQQWVVEREYKIESRIDKLEQGHQEGGVIDRDNSKIMDRVERNEMNPYRWIQDDMIERICMMGKMRAEGNNETMQRMTRALNEVNEEWSSRMLES